MDADLETIKHIQTVQLMMRHLIDHLLIWSGEMQVITHCVIDDLMTRLLFHDLTKLEEPERSTFAEYTAKLRGTTYGSREYKQFLAKMKPALEHHYQNNRHHPEFHPNGFADMNLLDLIELLVDWKAATLRHADGNLSVSIEQNQARFGYSNEMKALLRRTAKYLGFL